MKRFIFHLFLFSLPIGAGIALLLAYEMPRKYVYNEIQKDIRTGNWFFNRIYQSSKPIDIAFVGTSKTLCNVHDALIQYHLANRYHQNWQVANCAMNWFGNNLHWLLMTDIIEYKNPHYMIIEVGFDIKTESHRLFPLLANTDDLWHAPLLNTNYISDLGKGIWNRWLFQREHLLGIVHQYDSIPTDSLHSSLMWWEELPLTPQALENDSIADPTLMQRSLERAQSGSTSIPQQFPQNWFYNLSRWSPKVYYERIAKICQQKQIKLIFLYLPTYSFQQSSPRDAEYYRSLGELWLPPDSVFRNPHNFFDPDHLNRHGAVQLADWLAERLSGRIRQDSIEGTLPRN